MTEPHSVRSRLLGSDTPRDLIGIAALFAVFLVIDRLTLRLSALPVERLTSPFLGGAAAVEQPLALTLLLMGLAGGAVLGRGRFIEPWSALQHGGVARTAATAGALWLAWGTSAYSFNYVLDTWHSWDRLLVCALAAGVVWRPIFLVPFLAQVRVVSDQFAFPFGTDYGQAADGIIVLTLIAIGGAHLLYVARGFWRASPVVLVVTTIVASHFFEPGLGKLSIDWLTTNDTAHLPANAFAAGWMAWPGGAYAAGLSAGIAVVDVPLRVLVMLMELGAAIAVAHYALLRLWLPAFVAFHVATFAMTGFFFADWIALELGLLALVTMPSYTALVSRNATPVRAVIAIGAVLVGGFLYHPPRLAWLDAPVGYGYAIEAVGESGKSYRVEATELAPFTQDVTFGNLVLAPRRPLSGGYGATSSPQLLESLRGVDRFEDLEALEVHADPAPLPTREASEQLLLAYFDWRNADEPGPSLPRRPPRFWTRGPGPRFTGQEHLVQLRVEQVTSLGAPANRQVRRTPLLTVADGPEGRAMVILRAALPTR